MSAEKGKMGFLNALHDEYCNKKCGTITKAREFLNSLAGQEEDVFNSFKEIYHKVAEEFAKNNNTRKHRSTKNWRWEKEPALGPKNTSREKQLEKKVVLKVQSTEESEQWANQVPVASGVFSIDDKGRLIDLVYRINEGSYEFIELKIDDENPVYAAFEVLLYGMMYVFYRKHVILAVKKDAEKELLKANSIMLTVAAPRKYYRGYAHLDKFQNVLSRQLSQWVSGKIAGLKMEFRFDCFDYDGSKEITEEHVGNFLSRKPYC